MGIFRSDFSLTNFIRSAKAHGLLTAFLEMVQSQVVLSASGEGGEDMFQPMLPPILSGRLSLSNSTLEAVEGMSLAPPSGEALGIQTIYHEAMHAYIELNKLTPEVKAILDLGKKHYRRATLSDNTQADDEHLLVHEALGEYVGHRASAFWKTAEKIYLAQRNHKAGKTSGKFWDGLRAIPRDYDTAMGMRVFGYQYKGPFWNSRQVETKRPIPSRFKEFCDRVVLENAIPDQFARVKRFVDPYRVICSSLKGFSCPV